MIDFLNLSSDEKSSLAGNVRFKFFCGFQWF